MRSFIIVAQERQDFAWPHGDTEAHTAIGALYDRRHSTNKRFFVEVDRHNRRRELLCKRHDGCHAVSNECPVSTPEIHTQPHKDRHTPSIAVPVGLYTRTMKPRPLLRSVRLIVLSTIVSGVTVAIHGRLNTGVVDCATMRPANMASGELP